MRVFLALVTIIVFGAEHAAAATSCDETTKILSIRDGLIKFKVNKTSASAIDDFTGNELAYAAMYGAQAWNDQADSAFFQYVGDTGDEDISSICATADYDVLVVVVDGNGPAGLVEKECASGGNYDKANLFIHKNKLNSTGSSILRTLLHLQA